MVIELLKEVASGLDGWVGERAIPGALALRTIGRLHWLHDPFFSTSLQLSHYLSVSRSVGVLLDPPVAGWANHWRCSLRRGDLPNIREPICLCPFQQGSLCGLCRKLGHESSSRADAQ